MLGKSLEDKLADVSTKDELWEVMHHVITRPFPRGNDESRLKAKEAEAFVEGGLRVGYSTEELALNYWMRANKETLDSSLEIAKKIIIENMHLDDFQAMYDLQHAIEQHIGWMQHTGVQVPRMILDELAEHAKVIAYHASGNVLLRRKLMPLVEALSGVLGDDPSLKEARVLTAKSQVRRFFEDPDDAIIAARALNTLQQDETDSPFFGYVIANIGQMFTTNTRSAIGLLQRWNWSVYSDHIYGKLLATISDPKVSKQDIKRIFDSSFTLLLQKSKPSPAAARALYAELEYLAVGQSDIEPNGESMNFLQGVITRELEHKGIERATISPSNLGALLQLYRKFGGETSNHFGESMVEYIKTGLISKDVYEVATLAGTSGVKSSELQDIYTEVFELFSREARAYVNERVPNSVIGHQKTTLAGWAGRLVELSALIDDVTDKARVHAELGYAAYVLPRTRFGIGLHYLSSLVVKYEREFKESPRQSLSEYIDLQDLKRHFERELNANDRAPINTHEKREIAQLYLAAHIILYGEPIAIRVEKEKVRQAQKPVNDRIIVYVGDKKIDGRDKETVELLQMGLEGRIQGTGVEQGTLPGREEPFYGISMTRKDFVRAVQEGLLPPVQGVYINGSVPDVVSKTGRFYVTPSQDGMFIGAANIPRAFALHQINALAMAFSGNARDTSQSRTYRK